MNIVEMLRACGDSISLEAADSIVTLREDLGYAQERENRLRAAIAEHHRQKVDDRCIDDDDHLYAAAGLPPCDRRVGDKAAMLRNCERFIDRRCEGGGWPSYVELEAEVAKLKKLEEKLNYLYSAGGPLSQHLEEVQKLRADNEKLRRLNEGLAERVAKQSELLSKNAEKGILCGECGTRYKPMTDAFTCPCCGTHNFPN